jgi:hypothetical protein
MHFLNFLSFKGSQEFSPRVFPSGLKDCRRYNSTSAVDVDGHRTIGVFEGARRYSIFKDAPCKEVSQPACILKLVILTIDDDTIMFAFGKRTGEATIDA